MTPILDRVNVPADLKALTDAELRRLKGEAFRERVDGGLAGAVDRQRRKRAQRDAGTNVHDDTGFSRTHARQNSLSHSDRANNIGLEKLTGLGDVYALQHVQHADPGIVDQRIDNSDVCNGLCDAVCIRDIEHQDL